MFSIESFVKFGFLQPGDAVSLYSLIRFARTVLFSLVFSVFCCPDSIFPALICALTLDCLLQVSPVLTSH
jgi:hypothetical protein